MLFLILPLQVEHEHHHSMEDMATIIVNVVDEKGNAIAYCAYSLYKDNNQVAGGYCDEKGNIKIENIGFGNYKLNIEYIGYETKTININVNRSKVELGKVSLSPKGVVLQEQKVIAQPPQITYEEGKRIIRPSQDIVNSGGNAFDVLKNVPGIRVDPQTDYVEMRGSANITLYINGRPTSLEVSEALKQIPASQIDRIEIITNPSAKYEAEGSTIINIVLKTSREEGLSYSASLRTGTYNNYGGNLLVGISRNKYKISTSINYNNFNFPFKMNVEREFSNDSIITSANGSRYANPYGIRLNLDYNLTKNDIISFEGNLSHWSFNFGGNGITSGSRNYNSEFSSNRGGLNSSIFLGYARNSFNSGIFYSQRNVDELSYNYDRDMNGNIIDGNKTTEKGPANNIRFNFDFDNKKLAFGYLLTIFSNNDDFSYYSYDINNSEFVLRNSYNVNFYRITNGGYLTYHRNYKNFDFQIGTRLEYTRRTIENYQKEYLDLFPSLNLSYKFSLSNQIYFNYSRRINHPRIWQLEPFEIYLDQISKRRGNPNLDPEYSNLFEIGFQNLFLNLSLYYRKTDRTIEEITIVENGYFVNYPENIGISEFYGSEISFNFTKGKLLDFNTSFNIHQHNVYSDIVQKRTGYMLKSSLRILFLQISAAYNSAMPTSQGKMLENYYVDIGLRIPYRDFAFILNFQDVFKTFQFGTIIEQSNFYQYQNSKRAWPSIQFLLIYNFQQYRKLQKPKHQEEEGEFEGF